MTSGTQETRRTGRGQYDLAAAALLMAGVGLVAVLLPGWAFAGGILAAAAAVLALGAIALPGRSTRWGGVGLVLALGAVGWSVHALLSPGQESVAPTAEPTADPIPPGATVITYEIATDGLSVTHLSYVDVVDGVPTMVEALGVPPPFQHRVVLPSDHAIDLSDLSVTGMGGATSRRTTCRITVDGRTVATSSADSAYGLVTCAVPREPVD